MSESLLSPSPADPQDAEAPLPPPSRPRGPMSLVVLATLAVGYTLWAAQDIILPVLLAVFFALVGNPILRLLQKLWIPRALGALLILGAGLGVTGSLAVQLIGPAMEWAQEAPQQLRKVARQVQDLTKPVQQANQAAENFARVAGGDSNHKVQVIRTQLDDPYRMLTRAPRLAASVLAVVLLTLFFMIYGQSLQRAAIALFPNRQQQRFTTDILRSIEREVSRYVLTISVINTLVGLVFAGVLPDAPAGTAATTLPTARGAAAPFFAADSAFAALAGRSDAPEAFFHFAAPDAVTFGRDGRVNRGPAAIRSALRPGATWSWAPVAGAAAPGGDIGWTVGEAAITPPGGGTFYSKYLTVWRTTPAGPLFVADAGNARPAPAP